MRLEQPMIDSFKA